MPLGGEAGAHAGRERDFAAIRHQGRIAFEDIDELVLLAVAMQQRGIRRLA